MGSPTIQLGSGSSLPASCGRTSSRFGWFRNARRAARFTRRWSNAEQVYSHPSEENACAMKILKACAILVLLTAPALARATDSLDRAAAAIDQVMQAHAVAGDFNGTVLVAREGHIIYER